MKVFYSDKHIRHNPPIEIFDGGEPVPYYETAERMERVLSALQADSRYSIHPPQDFGLDAILQVHDAGYINFLKTAFTRWQAEHSQNGLMPATFRPSYGSNNVPTSLLGQAGFYTMDLSAAIVAGTFDAAVGSAHSALNAAQELNQHPESAVFALCRPPGHHAGKANCGGYCFINNAAVAANWLASKGKVALLDVDYHAGNGTQDIFYERNDVLTISIHGDPNEEYPYYNGYADETGTGRGVGFHRNFPLKLGADERTYLQVLSEALSVIHNYQPDYLVISAGMDIYGADPLGKIRISTQGIGLIGQAIAALKLPTLIVMEGGYNNDMLGINMATFLGAFHEN